MTFKVTREGELAGRGELVKTCGKFAAQQKISEEDALKVGLQEKAQEFVEKGAEIYVR